MPSRRWEVHKFGGTSVAGADRYRGVAAVLAGLVKPAARQAVVVSAMSKVTDALIEAAELARARDNGYGAKLEAILDRHSEAARDLLGESPARTNFEERLARDGAELKEVLRGVYLSRSGSERVTELVAGHGEIWSAQLLCACLRAAGREAAWLDARDVLVVEPGESSVTVDWDVSRAKLAPRLADLPAGATWVITGFIASTPDGVPTTLKRNGSDYSASIFGKLLNASEIVIWTDVDGVLSADPRLVPEAQVLTELSYDEATELAYFGAKVVHPSTMMPAIEGRIPIWIRNTFRPEAPGTVIRARPLTQIPGPPGPVGAPVKGFATIEKVALVNVEGTGMIGVPGVAQRLFGALKEVGVSVIMISQASSEHSICFAIPEAQAKVARVAVEKAFFAELHHGQISRVEIIPQCAVLAAVGDNMVSHSGIAGRFFGALGRAGVSVRAIAQGSSERNISAVVNGSDAVRALRAAHAGFYLSSHTLSVGVIGPGLIGGTLLAQLGQVGPGLLEKFQLDVRVRAVASSKTMLFGDLGLDPATARRDLDAAGVPADLDAFADYVQAPHLPHAVIIDCTSSQEVADLYPLWLSRGIHLITPNKKANSGTMESYARLREAERARGARFLYATNVGAGLPILRTLRDLVRTGDRVIRVEGVFSGTLSFLFNGFDGSRPFSAAVLEARAKGFTEPDPRDDLSGMDVARKLVILAREAGESLELSDVRVESLVPAELRAGSREDFLRRLPEFDEAMAVRVKAARSRGECLRYVGVLEPGGGGKPPQASVELRGYLDSHAFARTKGGDNIVAFRTARYDNQPLIVQGPGAGPAVTAGGVFGDLLRLAAQLGAPI